MKCSWCRGTGRWPIGGLEGDWYGAITSGPCPYCKGKGKLRKRGKGSLPIQTPKIKMKTKRKSIKVYVTRIDIERGKRCHSCKCPVARAIRRHGWPGARVGGMTVSEKLDGDHPYSNLPIRAQNFIGRFDAGEKVKPFSFTLKLPV